MMKGIIMDRISFHENVHFYLLCALVISLPYHLLISTYLIILITFNFLLTPGLRQRLVYLKNEKYFFLFSGYFFLLVIGLLYSSNLRYAFSIIERSVAFLLFPLFVFCNQPLRSERFYTLLKCFLFSCLIATFICLISRSVVAFRQDTPFDPSLFSHYNLTADIRIHPIYLAVYLSFAIFLVLFVLLKQRVLNWYVAILLVAHFTVFIVLLGAKTIVFVNAAIILSSVFLLSKAQRFLFLVVALVMIPFFLITYFNFEQTRGRFERMLDKETVDNTVVYGSFYLRLEKWKSSMRLIRENFFTGVGTGDSQDELMKQYKTDDFNYALENQWNSHNQYLSTGIAHGIPGIILLVAMFAIPLAGAWREKNYIYAIFIFMVAVSCLTESMFQVNKGIIFYALFNAILFRHRRVLAN